MAEGTDTAEASAEGPETSRGPAEAAADAARAPEAEGEAQAVQTEGEGQALQTEDEGQAPDVPARAELEEVRSWAGFKLDELGGANAGRVEGAFVDEQSGQPEWLLVRLGRFGNFTVVPARDAVAVAGHVWVPYTREVIRGAPKADPKAPLTRPRELELLAYYGIAGDAGRAAELTGREPEGVTARPAQ